MQLQIPSVLNSIRYTTDLLGGNINISGTAGQILQRDLGLLVMGQLVFATYTVAGLKDATPGQVSAFLSKLSGTATIDFPVPALPGYSRFPLLGAAQTWVNTVTVLGRVSVSGTYVLELRGQSDTLQTTFLANNCALSTAVVLR